MEFKEDSSQVFSKKFILYSSIFIVIVGFLLYISGSFSESNLKNDELEQQPVIDSIISIKPNDV